MKELPCDQCGMKCSALYQQGEDLVCFSCLKIELIKPNQ
jgi:hypothetical protein